MSNYISAESSILAPIAKGCKIYSRYLDSAATLSPSYMHMKMMYAICRQIKAKKIVELGVDNGRTTWAFLAAADKNNGHVTSCDIADCVEIKKEVSLAVRDNDAPATDLWAFIQESDLELVKKWQEPIDFLYIDTLHNYTQLSKELEMWSPFVKDGGVIAIHDTTSFAYLPNTFEFKSLKERLGFLRNSVRSWWHKNAWLYFAAYSHKGLKNAVWEWMSTIKRPYRTISCAYNNGLTLVQFGSPYVLPFTLAPDIPNVGLEIIDYIAAEKLMGALFI